MTVLHVPYSLDSETTERKQERERERERERETKRETERERERDRLEDAGAAFGRDPRHVQAHT